MSEQATPENADGARPALAPGPKFLVDFGPLLAFFAAYYIGGLMAATATIMAATALALAASWLLARHIPAVPLFSAALIGVFGGLTLWFADETFIKLKPTIINGLFATALFGGLAVGRPLLRPLLGTAMHLDEAGWRGLSLRWGFFFVFMAGLNEVVWRTQSTDLWVSFKVFGLMGLTFVFALTQIPYIRRHTPPEAPPGVGGRPGGKKESPAAPDGD